MSLFRRVSRTLTSPLRSKSGRSILQRMIVDLARLGSLDLADIAHRTAGIGKFQSLIDSGESYVVKSILPQLLPNTPILFDVGANIGEYAKLLVDTFPNAAIHAFEPNPRTHATLVARIQNRCFTAVAAAVGEKEDELQLFDYPMDGTSHASLYREVLTQIHHSTEVASRPVRVVTLDKYCREQSIPHIDFLKIDAEGHELPALRGAKNLLNADRVGIIQFEFNEMNVISRAFLRDFYETLPKHLFYRVDSGRLISLGDYNSRNEVFRFQNILAVHRSLNEQLNKCS